MTKPTPKGFNKLEPCPECGRWKTSRHGGGLICTNIRRCSLAISIEDDVVMDNCMGSNTTGLACKELNRQYIGIEKDKNYYDISVSRVLS